MLGENRESGTQFLSMLMKRCCDQRGLHVGSEACEPNQHDSRMEQTLPEYEFAEVLVGG